jgi:hypothetical protein
MEKQEQANTICSRWEEIIKIWVVINELETKRLTDTKNWFFEKVSRTEKSLAKSTKKKEMAKHKLIKSKMREGI